RLATVAALYRCQSNGCIRERPLPSLVAVILQHVLRPELQVGVFADAFAADERPLQPIGMVHIVEPEPALDTQAVGVGWSIATIDIEDLLVLDVHLGLAADTAVGAERVDGA